VIALSGFYCTFNFAYLQNYQSQNYRPNFSIQTPEETSTDQSKQLCLSSIDRLSAFLLDAFS